SFSICNLPPEYRYRTSNLLLTSILPGPKEKKPDQIQRFLRPIISDLLRLWKHGIIVPTTSCPEGCLVRVALVAVVCDKPAAHKIGRFGSHSHTYLCTGCWITQADKDKPDSFIKDACTNAEQCACGEEYRKLTNLTARHNFVKLHVTRFTQLSRLPYFDLINQVVIDPMHNLFLSKFTFHFQSHITTVSCLFMSRSRKDPFLSYLDSKQDISPKPQTTHLT
ncbi:hypothetical protein PAXRUDRAFT_173579, partial [Paxillus rubicundulus Ve08.2h10]